MAEVGPVNAVDALLARQAAKSRQPAPAKPGDPRRPDRQRGGREVRTTSSRPSRPTAFLPPAPEAPDPRNARVLENVDFNRQLDRLVYVDIQANRESDAQRGTEGVEARRVDDSRQRAADFQRIVDQDVELTQRRNDRLIEGQEADLKLAADLRRAEERIPTAEPEPAAERGSIVDLLV